MLDLFNEIWQTMRTNKVRTALTGVAVTWGIFMLIVLLGMAKGVLMAFQSSPMASSPNTIEVWPGRTSMPYQGYKEGRQIDLLTRNLGELEHENSEHVKEATGRIWRGSVVIRSDNDYLSENCNGVYPSRAEQQSLKIIRGRFINDLDMKEQRKTIVLEKKKAAVLFPDTLNDIGNKVDVAGLAYTLVGVYEHEWQSEAYVPFTTSVAHMGYSDKLNQITIETQGVTDAEQSQQLEKDIKATIARHNSFHPDDSSGVFIWNRYENYLSMLQGMSLLNIMMWVIGVLTLLTGVVGVSNIMFVSVRERTHEIGVRRAIGAKPRSILWQVILESVVLTTLFGYLGIIFGTVVNNLLGRVFEDGQFLRDPHVDLGVALAVTGVLIVAGALAGIFPARRALKIKPVEALRTE